MKNLNNILAAVSKMSGLTFTVVGPFFVADVTHDPEKFASIPVGQHGMELVGESEKTKSHIHDIDKGFVGSADWRNAKQEMEMMPIAV